MNKKVISYDLGTGGVNVDGRELSYSFEEYDTYYPKNGWHEQNPNEWWEAVVKSTKKLLKNSKINPNEIVSLAISGHSLGVIPIGKKGELLRERTPIWSDTRALKEANDFFKTVEYEKWYYDTGAGFPANLYSIFKILWYKNNEREIYDKVDKFIGTKDYINFKMTNRLCTDHSYASGSGAYVLKDCCYNNEYIKKAGLDKSVFPDILLSTDIIGTLTKEASEVLGLPISVKVACGGVDNSCMALGAKGIKNGRTYTSLGSSSWIAVTSDTPIVDFKVKPYVFAHIIPQMYASATCIFSAGTSHKWVLNALVNEDDKENAYDKFEKMASQSPVGSNKLLFNPSLAGGSGLDKSS
ncbi:MAG: xylulokinase, partial [Peptostreptococcaceae bacterium]